MQFNSIAFIFTFLPIFLALYYMVPGKGKHVLLLMGSVLFYGINTQWDLCSLALLLGLTGLTFLAARGLRPIIFCGAITAMTLLLVFFKCYCGGKYLPAGMSFYLFQMAAYLVSVYRGKQKPEKSLLTYSTGLLMFPRILSGPLMLPTDLAQQIRRPKPDARRFHNGLQVFILGLAMKVVLANRIGGLWSQSSVMGYESITTQFAWLSLTAFTMKLYFDFFGYSLMAVGLGRMLGFSLPHNFLDPYAARSVSEFYRRWHVTLGQWFRENIYIPLGGNRKGTGRTVIHLLIVWALTGLWHGVGGNYLLWAGILAAFIILERLWLGKYLEKSRVLCHVYTVLVIFLSWVPFAIGNWQQMLLFFGRLFGIGGEGTDPMDYVYWLEKYASMLVAGVFLMTPWARKLWKRIQDSLFADILCFVLFWVSVYFVATAAQDPFMYGQY